MLNEILKNIEQEINHTEYEWVGKTWMLKVVDIQVEKLLSKVLVNYTVLKDIHLNSFRKTRSVSIYQGKPKYNETKQHYIKSKPVLKIWYTVDLISEDRNENDGLPIYEGYNLKKFSFTNEYNYNLEDKFEEITKEYQLAIAEQKKELNKTKEEFIQFLDNIKYTIQNDKPMTDEYTKTKDEFDMYMKKYKELVELP
jgi:hypothetical protein